MTAVTLGAVAAASRLPKVWRGQAGAAFDRVQPWWFYGEIAWRGWVRAIPSGSVTFLVMLVSLWVSFLAGGFKDGAGGAARPIFLVLVIMGIFLLTLAVLVFLLNWPKAAVAPHLRSQPGALQEWAARRRARRQGATDGTDKSSRPPR